MKITAPKFILFFIFWFFLLLLTWCDSSFKSQSNQISNTDNTQNIFNSQWSIQSGSTRSNSNRLFTWALSDIEQSGLLQMREEEKLARDVYTTLWSKRENKIFTNIIKSEQTHMTSIKLILNRYSIDDPVKDDSIGIFTSPTMQKLYDDLVAQWNKSLLDALIVWATIEDLDINDLNSFTKQTSNTYIINTYNNLAKWSRNHIRAYVKSIISNGGTYIPQYISQSQYDEIIASSQENNAVWRANSVIMWNRNRR